MSTLSIITINYNNLPGLQKTLTSVWGQLNQNFEFIIIDGGSTDGSMELIENNSTKFTYWVSEKDKGIYNAMNKGIVKATGEYLLFLNSGDSLTDENSLNIFFLNQQYIDVICADIKIYSKESHWVKQAPDVLSFDYFTKDTLPHQSAFIKRSLFNRVGMYNEELRFVADWKFYLDAFCKHNATYLHINKTICEYNYDGISSLPENALGLHSERDTILAAEYHMFYQDYKKYDQTRAALKNYTNSRLHSIVSIIMQWAIYRFLKKSKEQ